ncbi:MAG: hypothetical protein ACXWZP_02145, partial [Gaiellaceae bacterium]
AFGALVELVRSGAIAPGERVVLVVTGSGMKPRSADFEFPARQIEADADDFLAALGVGRD